LIRDVASLTSLSYLRFFKTGRGEGDETGLGEGDETWARRRKKTLLMINMIVFFRPL
jgi:hypothetical protein